MIKKGSLQQSSPCTTTLLTETCQRGFLSGTTVTLSGFSRGGHRWGAFSSFVESKQCFCQVLRQDQARLQAKKNIEVTSTHIVLCQALWACGRKIMETLVMWVLARGQRKAFYILGGVESFTLTIITWLFLVKYLLLLLLIEMNSHTFHVYSYEWERLHCSTPHDLLVDTWLHIYWSIWIIITRSVRTRCIFISLTPWISLDTVVAWPCQRIQPWSALNQGELNALNKTHAG